MDYYSLSVSHCSVNIGQQTFQGERRESGSKGENTQWRRARERERKVIQRRSKPAYQSKTVQRRGQNVSVFNWINLFFFVFLAPILACEPHQHQLCWCSHGEIEKQVIKEEEGKLWNGRKEQSSERKRKWSTKKEGGELKDKKKNWIENHEWKVRVIVKRKGRVLVWSLSTSLTGWYSDISIVINNHISIMINTSISIRSTAGRSTGERATDNSSSREREHTKSKVYMWGKKTNGWR